MPMTLLIRRTYRLAKSLYAISLGRCTARIRFIVTLSNVLEVPIGSRRRAAACHGAMLNVNASRLFRERSRNRGCSTPCGAPGSVTDATVDRCVGRQLAPIIHQPACTRRDVCRLEGRVAADDRRDLPVHRPFGARPMTTSTRKAIRTATRKPTRVRARASTAETNGRTNARIGTTHSFT